MQNIRKVSFAFIAWLGCTNAQAIDIATNGDTTISVGGYIKAEGMLSLPDEGDSDFEAALRELRVNLKTNKTIGDKHLTSFVEGNFYKDYKGFESGSPEFKLRHAYVQLDDLTVGKTWNGQAFALGPLITEQLDYWGNAHGTMAGGGFYIRPDLTVSYAHKGLRLTAQDPVYDEANFPDMVVSYNDNISNLKYNLAVTAREAETEEGSDVGLGISLAGKLPLGNGALHASIYNGQGMGVYSGTCVAGFVGLDGSKCDSEDGKLVSQTGYNLGYTHNFTKKLRGNINYGEVNVNDISEYSVGIKSATLIYKYLSAVDLGIEWRDRTKTTLPWREKGNSFEIMAKYNF